MRTRLMYCLLLSLCLTGPAMADMFLVKTSEGPGFAAPDEAAEVLEKGILPTFDRLMALQANKTIVAAGLPVGSRTFYMMVEAASHEEVDRMLRELPAWGVFSWKVMPLQSIGGRAAIEREILKSLQASN